MEKALTQSGTRTNSATTKKPAGDTDSEEGGLVVKHALPAQQTLKSQNKWIVDSGATSHMCNDKACFTHLYSLKIPLEVKLGDGRSLRAFAQGSVKLTIKNGHQKY
uniref:Retrovirus-related Pol polyprotein from transposon TNT 1-94-like beta-barrel domain-containing protein n=1 Tax=Amphimedon queenslandica TaxID=400682 RepID=A0A1X7U565_AMPQE